MLEASEWISTTIGWPVVGWVLVGGIVVYVAVLVAYEVTGEIQRRKRRNARRRIASR